MGDQLAMARLLATAGAVHALALLALLALIFVAGFVGKAFDASLEWRDVMRCFNVRHVLTGVTTTGLGSIIGWATSLGGVGGGNGWRFIVGDAFVGDNRADNNVLGTLIGAAAVIAGLCMAFSWIYARLEQWARSTTRHAQHIVLDAQGGRPPSAAERRAASEAAATPGAAGAAGVSADAQRPFGHRSSSAQRLAGDGRRYCGRDGGPHVQGWSRARSDAGGDRSLH